MSTQLDIHMRCSRCWEKFNYRVLSKLELPPQWHTQLFLLVNMPSSASPLRDLAQWPPHHSAGWLHLHTLPQSQILACCKHRPPAYSQRCIFAFYIPLEFLAVHCSMKVYSSGDPQKRAMELKWTRQFCSAISICHHSKKNHLLSVYLLRK